MSGQFIIKPESFSHHSGRIALLNHNFPSTRCCIQCPIGDANACDASQILQDLTLGWDLGQWRRLQIHNIWLNVSSTNGWLGVYPCSAFHKIRFQIPPSLTLLPNSWPFVLMTFVTSPILYLSCCFFWRGGGHISVAAECWTVGRGAGRGKALASNSLCNTFKGKCGDSSAKPTSSSSLSWFRKSLKRVIGILRERLYIYIILYIYIYQHLPKGAN